MCRLSVTTRDEVGGVTLVFLCYCSVGVLRAYVSCLRVPASRLRASSSWMSWTRSASSGPCGSGAAMMRWSRPSTSCLPAWTDWTPTSQGYDSHTQGLQIARGGATGDLGLVCVAWLKGSWSCCGVLGTAGDGGGSHEPVRDFG